MTWTDNVRRITLTILRWVFGLAFAALGTYILVARIAVWPGIGVLAFGVFIINPSDLSAFASWIKTNAGDFLNKPGRDR